MPTPSAGMLALRRSWVVLSRLLMLVLLLGGCTRKEPRGQLMVTILTDAPLPDYVDGIRLQAFQEANGVSTLIFDREPEVRVGAGNLLIPTTLAIVGNGRASDRVRLVLLARKFGKPRVLREAVTQVPRDRIAELHLLIEWLCDGSAEAGDPMFCSDPEYTCAGGRCIPKWIDPATLPDYVPGGGGSGGDAGVASACFDVASCFAASQAVPLVPEDCSVLVPGEGLGSLNLALVVKPDSGGQCLKAGNCLISLSRGPLGWDLSTDRTRILLPPAVCTSKAGLISAVVASRQCPTKRPVDALCGAWSPFGPSLDAGTIPDAAQSLAGSCALDSDCASGHCANGTCCDSACAGACRSCSVSGAEGTCLPLLPGTVDVTGTCPREPPATCGFDGTCNGEGGCRLWASGTTCAVAACQPPATLTSSVCNGAGACQSSIRQCAPFRCGPGACVLACSRDQDCVSGFYCNQAKTCVKHKTQGQACSYDAECDLGYCGDGVCCNTSCQGYCRSCVQAGAIGMCTPLPYGSASAGECGTSVCSGLQAANPCVPPAVARVGFNHSTGSDVLSVPETGIGRGKVHAGSTLGSPTVPGTWVAGKSGNALRLDGVNQHVVFPVTPALDAFSTAGTFTIAAWVRALTLPPGDAWAVARTTPTGLVVAYALGLSDGFPSAGFLVHRCQSTSQLLINTWTHLAATYDGLAVRTYVNGELVCTLYGSVPGSSAPSPLIIGATEVAGSLSSFWPGDIDDVFLIERALPDVEIKALSLAP